MNIVFLLLFLLILPTPSRSSSSAQTMNTAVNTKHVERFLYEAVPRGKEDETEQIRVALSFDENSIALASTAVSEKMEEKIWVEMTGEGHLIWGTRSFVTESGSRTETRMRRDKRDVYFEITSDKGKETKVLEIPKGKTLAVEASLFVLLRFFPYDSGARWDLFMMDFAGRSVSCSARQKGVEEVVVQSVRYLCYRMEIVFDVPIINPKVVCWVTVEEPHVVVRSIGKRGISTPTFTTNLKDVFQRLPGPTADAG